MHAHRAAWGRRPMYRDWYGLGAGDRMLHAGAFNWTYTLGTGLTDPWANGATALVALGAKPPQTWPSLIRETGATIFAAVPGIYRQMLKYADDLDDLGALRHGLMAGEAPPLTLRPDWTDATGLPIYEALGMSEISTYVSTSPDVPPRDGSAGRPQSGRSIAILPPDAPRGRDEQVMPLPAGEEGLLAVHRSDPGMMLGYWELPDEDAAVSVGEWFVGGDLARMDDDGYVFHLGRETDVMNAGGFRVSPAELEDVLCAVNGVHEIACAEVEVREDVRVICAFVVMSETAPGWSELEAQ
ncbi:MAG: AMP-binding protein, partial [Pseudomonadota bacterium]